MKTTACKLRLRDTVAGSDNVIAGSDNQTESVQAVLATELQQDKCGAKSFDLTAVSKHMEQVGEHF